MTLKKLDPEFIKKMSEILVSPMRDFRYYCPLKFKQEDEDE